MNVSTSLAGLFDLQVPQILVLVYMATSGAIMPVILDARRTVRGGRSLGRLAGAAGMVLATLFAVFVLVLLVALVVVYLAGVILKVVVASAALLLIAGTVVSAWPLRRRTMGWLCGNPATQIIDDARLHVLADRHTMYLFTGLGLLMVWLVIGLTALVLGFLANLSDPSDAQVLWTFLAAIGSVAVVAGGVEVLQRFFPEAVLIQAYRRGRYTTRLVDLCDRCFSRQISRAPDSLRTVYQVDAEKKLAAMAKALHRSECDSPAVRTAIHDALAPSLSLGGQDVVHRLGSGTPSLRADLTRAASVLAVSAGAVASIQFLVGVVAPLVA